MHKVSVIMPCYNSEKYIAESIESVLNQTHQRLELLICDDGSSDRSVEIIKEFKSKDSRIKFFVNSYSKGAPGARNTCMDHAVGDFVSFLDSDDLWMKDKLEKQLKFMLLEGIDFSYSYNNVIDETGKYICMHKSPNEVDSNKLCFANFIPCSTVIYNANRLGYIYQPYIKKRNDFALWLKILNINSISAKCYREVTSSYRSNSYGLSSNRIDAIKYFYKCLIDFNNCTKSSALFYTCNYLYLILIKKRFPNLYNWLVLKFF